MADPRNGQRWTLVVLMSVVGLSLAGFASWFHAGWRIAAISTYLEVGLVCAFILWTRDPMLRALLIFGVIVGFGELPADAFSVLVKQTLVYPHLEPKLWASPLYMPFSWIAVMVQMGFIASWLTQRLRLGQAMVIMALIGGSYVPVFEYLAHSANFWYYQDCRMLMGITPYYVILAEGAILAALPPLLQGVERRSTAWLVGVGIVESAVIYGASRLAFLLVG
jgi:hypothetical protein